MTVYLQCAALHCPACAALLPAEGTAPPSPVVGINVPSKIRVHHQQPQLQKLQRKPPNHKFALGLLLGLGLLVQVQYGDKKVSKHADLLGILLATSMVITLATV